MLVSYGGTAANLTQIGQVVAFTTSGSAMFLLVPPSPSTNPSATQVVIVTLEVIGGYYGVIFACLVLTNLFFAILGNEILKA